MVDRHQLTGSEYGGVDDPIAGGIQPKDSSTLKNGDRLRLGYLTGNEESTSLTNVNDRRQFLGLRPANGRRPIWLDHVADDDSIADLESEARRLGYGGDQ